MEWQNVSRHLKELKDNCVASSQTSIEWNISENEEENSPKKLFFIQKRKSKLDSPREALSNTKKDENPKLVKDPNRSKFSKGAHDIKSPVFKMKKQEDFQSHLSDFNNSFVKRKLVLSEANKPVLLECSSLISKHTVAESIVTDEVSPTTDIVSQDSSPILKSRVKNRNFGNNFPKISSKIITKPNFNKNLDTFCKHSVDISKQKLSLKNQFKGVENCSQGFESKEDGKDSETYYPSLLKYNTINELPVSQDSSQIKELELDINECMSPRSDKIKEINSSTSLTLESKESSTPLESPAKPKGSKWVKDLQYKTPEKLCYPSLTKNSPTDVPDSTRKKIKRNGLADQLRKYLKSWHSSFFMWDHQMSLEVSSHSSGSPPNHSDPSKSPLNLSSDNINVTKLENVDAGNKFTTKIPPPSSSFSFKDLCVSQNHKLQKEIISKSPKSTYVRESPDSLEIASLSESPATPQNRSTMSKKHMCLQVIRIEYQTGAMVSALCRRARYCSQKSKEDTPPMPQIVLGIFGYLDFKSFERLEAGDKVKIFAPWQLLEVKTLSYPVLFSSHFVSSKGSEAELEFKLKRTKLASWQCSCIFDSTVLPRSCSDGKLQIHPTDTSHIANLSKVTSTCRTFSSVKDSPKSSLSTNNRYWTVLEAVEIFGRNFDASVSVTFKVWRIYPRRNTPTDEEPSSFLVLGQDPSGVFLLVEAPNRPLIVTLSSLLQEGIGTTHTLTNLSVVERITDAQSPLLFSLIHSLEILHKQYIGNDSRLLPHLSEHLKKPPQSFCYKFAALLGVTSDILITGAENRSLSSPHFDVEEALKQDTGTRVCVPTHVLYYVQPHLYVASRCEDKFTSLHKFVVKDSVWFPSWMKCDGTIMTPCLFEDIVVWNGSLIVDEFTRVQRKSSELQVSFEDILCLISKIGANSVVYDLVFVKGLIKNVNEEDACSWDECPTCGDLDLYLVASGNIKCRRCKLENISTVTKFSLEVILQVDHDAETPLHVRIKLFQATIQKLLKGTQSQNKQYKMDDFLGVAIGPLICVVRSQEETNSGRTFTLVELPY